MQSFKEADQVLQGRCKQSRKLGNNTYLERRPNNQIAVRLHRTDIITYHPDGSCTLNAGGWKTVTTKDRLNKYSPVCVWQAQSIWYVSENSPYADKNTDRYLFTDNMLIDSIGVSDAKVETDKDRKAVKTLKARIKTFAKLCADNCIGIRPSNGDCWHCLMKTKDRVINVTDHLESHMRARYPVPSLIYAACKRFGASQAAMSAIINGESWAEDHAKETVKRSVRRYMYEQFGLAS